MKYKTKKRIQYSASIFVLATLALVVLHMPFGTEESVDMESESESELQDEGATLSFPALEPDVEIGTDGFVAAVETTGDAANATSLITLQTEVNSVYFVAVPLDPATACEAGEAIADVRVIMEGDKIAVRGKTDADGRIVPCESEHHSLRIRGVYENPDVGLTFNYKKSPEGYVLMTEGYDFSTSSLFVTGALLLPYNMLGADRPPATIVRVYQNPENLNAEEWARANEAETLIHRITTEPAAITVGGRDAVGYTLRGPFYMDVYVVAYDGSVLMINGEYAEYDSEPFRDIGEMVRTISFTK